MKTKIDTQSPRANFYRFLLLLTGFLLICTAGWSVDFITQHVNFSRLRAVNTVFLSILTEAFPFLLFGVALILFPGEKTAILAGIDDFSCDCDHCCETPEGRGLRKKIEAVFSHAGSEFFDVGRYLIAGALLSGIFQALVPKDIPATGGIYGVSLLVMMLRAFVLSVCSTSDAFIARTFVNQFPPGAVLGFMVIGPMIDLKNLFMLMGRFKKSFVIKLVFLIFGFSYALLLLFSKVRL